MSRRHRMHPYDFWRVMIGLLFVVFVCSGGRLLGWW